MGKSSSMFCSIEVSRTRLFLNKEEVLAACVYACVFVNKRKKNNKCVYIYSQITGGASWLKTNLPLTVYTGHDKGATKDLTILPSIHVTV